MVWKKIAASCLLAMVILFLFTSVVHATSKLHIPKGISISPAVEQVSLHQNQKSETFTTTFTNNTASDLLVRVSARDFTASSNGTRLTFLKNNTMNSHGLSDNLQVDKPQFTIKSLTVQRIMVTISDADNLAPGGHYTALIYNAQNIINSDKKTVAVREAVSCLIFANTFGGGTQSTDIAALPFGKFRTTLPNNFQVVIANNGNAPTVPRGYAQIIGTRGKLYAQAILNEDSSMILPGSKRLLLISFKQTNGFALFGVYHLKLFYRHDGQSNYSIYDKKFLIVSKPILALISILVFMIVCLLYMRFKPKPKSKIVQKSPKRKYKDIVTK